MHVCIMGGWMVPGRFDGPSLEPGKLVQLTFFSLHLLGVSIDTSEVAYVYYIYAYMCHMYIY